MNTKDIKLWGKFLIGKLNVKDGSLCEFSKRFFDVHDYPVNKGGDGFKDKDYYTTFECPYCKTKFTV